MAVAKYDVAWWRRGVAGVAAVTVARINVAWHAGVATGVAVCPWRRHLAWPSWRSAASMVVYCVAFHRYERVA